MQLRDDGASGWVTLSYRRHSSLDDLAMMMGKERN